MFKWFTTTNKVENKGIIRNNDTFTIYVYASQLEVCTSPSLARPGRWEVIFPTGPGAFFERLTFWALEILGEKHLGEIAVLWL